MNTFDLILDFSLGFCARGGPQLIESGRPYNNAVTACGSRSSRQGKRQCAGFPVRHEAVMLRRLQVGGRQRVNCQTLCVGGDDEVL